MRRDRALEIFKQHVGPEDLVVAVYQTLFDWLGICPRPLNYVATGAMGQASSHGLGLALANPDRRVLVLDGDGSLLMNLGSLASVADAAPANFHHFVFANGTYEVNGDHPVPASGRIDFAAMASAAGYAHSESWKTLDQVGSRLAGFIDTSGPALAELAVEPGRSFVRDYRFIHGSEARDTFRQALNAGCRGATSARLGEAERQDLRGSITPDERNG